MRPLTEQEKKQKSILERYNKYMSEGWPKMRAYEALAFKYQMSVSGIRHAILCAKAANF